MKKLLLFSLFSIVFSINIKSQKMANTTEEKAIYVLIDNYSLAREKRDTVLLKSILTDDIDQLVSNGEWRYGIKEATKGMMQSSASNGGKRTLTVEKVKYLNKKAAIADARYEIVNNDGSIRKMWSSFMLVKKSRTWKISAIRNMLPAKQ